MANVLWPVDPVAGAPSYSGRLLRQPISAQLAGATGSRPFGGLSGVRPGTGAPITVTSTTWTVGVHSGVLDLETSGLAGATTYAFNTSQTGSINAAPGSPNTRIDILSIRHDDPSESDGSSVPQPTVVYTPGSAGTSPAQPATPARSMLIAIITVPYSGSPTFQWVAPNTVAAGGILPCLNSTFYPATPYEGMYVDDLILNCLKRYNGSAWVTVAVDAAERMQWVKIIPSGTVSTPASGTITWAATGGLVVPAWASKAIVNMSMNGMVTPSTALNVTAQLGIGSGVGSLNFRIPGSATNMGSYSWGYSDTITGLTAGAAAMNLFATFGAGSGVFQITANTLITFQVEFMP